MDRSDAEAVVAKAIADHYGITHLRMTFQGSFSGAGMITVTTLARPASGKRTKGTREFNLTYNAPIARSEWAAVAAALEPSLPRRGGCAARAHFDVDATGLVTNRVGFPSRKDNA